MITGEVAISGREMAMTRVNPPLTISPTISPGAVLHGRKQQGKFTEVQNGRELTVRAALSGDAAQLAAIGSAGFAAAHGKAMQPGDLQELVSGAWNEQQVVELIANPDVQLFVAQTEETIVGLACLNPTYPPDCLRQSATVELGRFYLHLDWIGYGAGSALMSHALHQAAITGYRICWLRVWQGNKTAIQFYRRWGFKTIATDTYAVGDSLIPVWVMIHSLTPGEDAAAIQWQ